jgi:tRNA modification GTPase
MARKLKEETIAAQATAPGRAGVAILRISGPKVINIMQAVLGFVLSPRLAHYLPFYAADKEIIDFGIALFFPHPHSFTGEDVLELQGHGGPIVIDLLLQHALTLGARLAQPGEFSERAFLNGKIDLTQAEAIADLINAQSQHAARLALRSLQGDFSKAIHKLSEKLIHLRMLLEAALDFSEEEIDFLNEEAIGTQFGMIRSDLQDIQAKAKQSSFLREGINVVIAGAPNVGKSSLLNYLSGNDIAIVSDIAGTTRDVLRDSILIDGMPMHIIDTAGLRDSEDSVEQEGIKRAYREIAQADLILYMTSAQENASAQILETSCPMIWIRNKIDLCKEQAGVKIEEGKTIVSLSAQTGEGIDLLKEQIKKAVGFQSSTEGLYLARRRHLDALMRADDFLALAIQELNTSKQKELIAEQLRLSQLALSEITGAFTVDDLLGRIFSQFCIGK